MILGMKGIWAIPVIVSILILGVIGFSFSQDAEAASIIFTTDTTITTSTTIASGDTWTINSGVTLTIASGVTLTVNNGGTIDNFGTINNFGGTINNSGTINNNSGSFITNPGTINNISGGTFSNSGTIFNKNSIGGILFGTIILTGGGSVVPDFGPVIIVDPSLIQQIVDLESILLSGEITICHNGDKTKTISLAAYGTHVGHGDTMGECI